MGKRIKNDRGRTVGEVRGNKVYDSSGRQVGRIGSFGAVRDPSGRTIGQVDSFGNLRNTAGGSMNGFGKKGR